MECKPKLIIHKSQCERGSCRTLGMTYFLGALRDSGLFDIGYHDEYLQTMRDYRATILYYNNKKIYLDFWEYPAPTHTDNVLNANFDLVIKLQHRNIGEEKYLQECRTRQSFNNKSDEEIIGFYNKIIPWTFFPSNMMLGYIGREYELWNNNLISNGFFCGKDWRCRKLIKKWIKREGMEYLQSDRREYEHPITDEEFLSKMKSSVFGIVAPGRGSWITDTKNRREIDYMMLKKPILMPYAPNYYFPLEDGKHYILWKGESLQNIKEKYDLSTIAENAYKWYTENARKDILGINLIKILKEKL